MEKRNLASAPARAKELIRAAFKNGEELTTYTGNLAGHTVDFRKVVSELRSEGMKISDKWAKTEDGRRFKVYFLA